MNFNIKANLLNGQFSISHTLTCTDFNPALIAISLMDNLKEHKLYGRVTLERYNISILEDIFSGIFENLGYGDGHVYNFTGIIITVPLPDDCVSNDFGENMDKDKRVHFYNCFFENFMRHMISCGMTAFFRYDIINDVMSKQYTMHAATVMIPTFYSMDGAFFNITKFSALEGMTTNVPHFDPLNGYEKTDAILKIPDNFHLEIVTLHSYTTGKEETSEWYVLVPNKTKSDVN